jgi:hypothetical protein
VALSYDIRARRTTNDTVGIADITSIREIQISQGSKPCFMTVERLFCKKIDCEWRGDCPKLIAVWKR